MSSPVEDVEALTAAIVAVLKTPEFDDMLWPEIDRALTLASHEVKVLFMLHGTLDPSPGA
jgi:hypothetical protein